MALPSRNSVSTQLRWRMSLDDLAEKIGTVTESQHGDSPTRFMTTVDVGLDDASADTFDPEHTTQQRLSYD